MVVAEQMLLQVFCLQKMEVFYWVASLIQMFLLKKPRTQGGVLIIGWSRLMQMEPSFGIKRLEVKRMKL